MTKISSLMLPCQHVQVTDLLYHKQAQLEEMAASKAVQQMTFERELVAARSEAERSLRCGHHASAAVTNLQFSSEASAGVCLSSPNPHVCLTAQAQICKKSRCNAAMSRQFAKENSHCLSAGAPASRVQCRPRCCRRGISSCPWRPWGTPTTAYCTTNALDAPSKLPQSVLASQL